MFLYSTAKQTFFAGVSIILLSAWLRSHGMPNTRRYLSVCAPGCGTPRFLDWLRLGEFQCLLDYAMSDIGRRFSDRNWLVAGWPPKIIAHVDNLGTILEKIDYYWTLKSSTNYAHWCFNFIIACFLC